MSLAILFHLLCAQHVSDINITIFRSLRLCWWITTLVVLFSVRCVLELWCGWFWVVFVLQAEAQLQPAKRTPPNISRNKSSNTQWTENKTTDVVIHQHSRRLLKMDILMSETCWAHNKWNKIASDIKLVFHSSTFMYNWVPGCCLHNLPVSHPHCAVTRHADCHGYVLLPDPLHVFIVWPPSCSNSVMYLELNHEQSSCQWV